MIRIAVIALAAAAALALGASSASAGVDFHINLSPGIGNGSYYPNYPIYTQPVYVEPDCHYVKVWNGKWVQKPNGQLKKKYVTKLICG